MRFGLGAHIENEQAAVGVGPVDPDADGLQSDRADTVDVVGGGGTLERRACEHVIGLGRAKHAANTNRAHLHRSRTDGGSRAGIDQTPVQVAGEREISFQCIGRKLAQRRGGAAIDRLHHRGETPELSAHRRQRVGARRQGERVHLRRVARQGASRVEGDASDVCGGRIDHQALGVQRHTSHEVERRSVIGGQLLPVCHQTAFGLRQGRTTGGGRAVSGAWTTRRERHRTIHRRRRYFGTSHPLAQVEPIDRSVGSELPCTGREGGGSLHRHLATGRDRGHGRRDASAVGRSKCRRPAHGVGAADHRDAP